MRWLGSVNVRRWENQQRMMSVGHINLRLHLNAQSFRLNIYRSLWKGHSIGYRPMNIIMYRLLDGVINYVQMFVPKNDLTLDPINYQTPALISFRDVNGFSDFVHASRIRQKYIICVLRIAWPLKLSPIHHRLCLRNPSEIMPDRHPISCEIVHFHIRNHHNNLLQNLIPIPQRAKEPQSDGCAHSVHPKLYTHDGSSFGLTRHNKCHIHKPITQSSDIREASYFPKIRTAFANER